MSELEQLRLSHIPEGRRLLREQHGNLARVAEYCHGNYLQAGDKRKALEETMALSAQALASVAYQVSSLASAFLRLLELQAAQLRRLEGDTACVAQMVAIHQEKVARCRIGALSVPVRSPSVPKVTAPPEPPVLEPYCRRALTFSALDHLGHGVKDSGTQLARSDTLPRRSSKRSSAPAVGTMGRSSRVPEPVRPPVVPEGKLPAAPGSPETPNLSCSGAGPGGGIPAPLPLPGPPLTPPGPPLTPPGPPLTPPGPPLTPPGPPLTLPGPPLTLLGPPLTLPGPPLTLLGPPLTLPGPPLTPPGPPPSLPGLASSLLGPPPTLPGPPPSLPGPPPSLLGPPSTLLGPPPPPPGPPPPATAIPAPPPHPGDLPPLPEDLPPPLLGDLPPPLPEDLPPPAPDDLEALPPPLAVLDFGDLALPPPPDPEEHPWVLGSDLERALAPHPWERQEEPGLGPGPGALPVRTPRPPGGEAGATPE